MSICCGLRQTCKSEAVVHPVNFLILSLPSGTEAHQSPRGAATLMNMEYICILRGLNCGRHGDVLLRSPFRKGFAAQV